MPTLPSPAPLRLTLAAPALLLLALLAACQGTSKQDQEAKYLRMYDTALAYNQPEQAITALALWQAQYPNAVQPKDSLARLYAAMGRFPQALRLANQLLEQEDSANTEWRAIQAVALLHGQQNYQAAYASLAKLVADKPKGEYLYHMAFAQMNLGNPQQANQHLNQLLGNTDFFQETIVITDNATGLRQTIKVQAAALNMKGLIAAQQGNFDQAINLYQQALVPAPNFVLARRNMQAAQLAKQKQAAGK